MRESARSIPRFTILPVLGYLWLFGCGGSSAGGGRHPGASGGTTGSGGAPGSGGTTGSGGATGSGGRPGAGGTTEGVGSGGGGSSSAAGTTGSGGATTATGSGGHGGASSGAAGTTGAAGPGGATPAKPSAGCTATTAPTAGRTTIDVSGTKREYILTLPSSYDSHQPYRLIIAFHGGQYNDDWLVNGDPPQSGPYYGIQSEADNAAIFVASQALSGSWTNQSNRDIDYVVAMVTRFKSELCIDENRVFATGFSMGGIMTNTVACVEPSIFRAVAAMSGRLPTTPATCTPDHEIAYWASHGMSDPTIPITDGQMARDKLVATNHCTGQATPVDSDGCTTYTGCDAGYSVVWCPFPGVHEPAPFAGRAIWRFLSQF